MDVLPAADRPERRLTGTGRPQAGGFPAQKSPPWGGFFF
ncbi:MAG: hypothetical protein HSCHL_1426 [Hydrogenibacillus schlegelii]|uniref:Uncharacterized protein n=1 Tax=Hydrogenibacillus schlegelii TaxID=1484 RepID=A0A2T5GCC7_HYDSH|nr:MAG: hypothetical protein HSCHL_1426 [Hydrogenibacillus schlegelii]